MAPVRLALLECDTPPPAIEQRRGTYWNIFSELLKASRSDVEFTLDGYDVVKEQKYPDAEKLKGESEGGYRGILISGSAASAYEDLPWINKLASFIAQTVKTSPHIKLIGICFGHQIIARALGGACVPNNGRWEVSVTDMELTQLGKAVFQTDRSVISIQQMHRDHVPYPPPSAHLLAHSAVTPVQGYIIPYSDSDPQTASSPDAASLSDPSNIHVFAVQGHPEFTSDIVIPLLDLREGSGVLTPELARDGRERAVRPHDGVSVVGAAIWRILGAGS